MFIKGFKCPNHPRRDPVRRGVCLTCYKRYAAQVSRGYATWSELEQARLVLPGRAQLIEHVPEQISVSADGKRRGRRPIRGKPFPEMAYRLIDPETHKPVSGSITTFEARKRELY